MRITQVVKNGNEQWQLSMLSQGRVRRRYFHTLLDAEEFAEEINTQQDEIMREIALLPLGKRAMLLEAYDLAAKNDAPLYECVQHYLATLGKVSTIKVDAAIERFLAAKADLRHKSLSSLTSLLGKFSAKHGTLELAQADRNLCQEFLFGEHLSPATIRGYKTRLGTFFNWAIDEGMLMSNPVKKIKVARGGAKAITWLNAEQCCRLLDTARRNDPGMVPILAIGMFAGVRMGEMRGQVDKPGLTWDGVYLDRPEPELEVADTVGKTGRRMVPISPNLKAWLERGGDLYPIKNHRNRLDKIRELSKLGELGQWAWDSSILRHTFASMHVAHHKNPDHTRYIMGHDEKSQVFKRHYDGRVSPMQAAKFWSIIP